MLQLPEQLELKNEDIANILDNAHSTRTLRSIRRQIAAHRVHQCENSLRLLREDLQLADKDLEEADSSIGMLQSLIQQYPVAAPNTELTTFYDSGASDQSASSDSDDSGSIAAAAG